MENLIKITYSGPIASLQYEVKKAFEVRLMLLERNI